MLRAKFKNVFDWKDWLALVSGSGVIIALGLSNITRWSVWFDEAFSEHIARHSFVDILKYTAADVHPPLYYWVLKVWRAVFGSSELAIRSLSLLFLVVAAILAYVLVRKLFSRKAAIASLVLLALSPMLFRYGIEARMYTMELCIVMGATIALVHAVSQRTRQAWMVYGLLIGLGILTHYLSLLVWATHAVWLLYCNRKTHIKQTIQKTIKSGYGSALLVAFCVVVLWLPFMVFQLANIQGGGFWIPPVSFNTIPNLISNMYTYFDSSATQGWLVLLIIAVLASSIYLVRSAYRGFTGVQKQTYLLLILSAVLPPVLLILASMPPLRSSFVGRYVLSSIALWMIVTGIAFVRIWGQRQQKKPLVLFACLLLGVQLVGCYQVYAVGNINKDNGSIHTMRSAMQLANATAQGSEPIIADSSWRYFEADYYAQPPHTIYFRSEDDTKVGAYEMLRGETDHKIVSLDDFGKTHPIAWYLTAQSRSDTSKIPAGWREIKTYLVNDPSELRIVKMQFIGNN